MNAWFITWRRISLSNLLIEVDTQPCIKAHASDGTFATCSADGFLMGAASGVAIEGMDDWLVNFKGVFGTGENRCTDGSTFQTLNSLRIRRSGVWENL